MATTSNAKIAPPQIAASFSIPAAISSRNALAYFLISIFLIVPCLWHRHIEAGDLGSHVYNAWLATLAQQGRAPGIYVVWQWNNILFDLLLFYFAKAFGFVVAEKIVVSVCVLIFFWGVFALLKAIGGKPPWLLAPLIAMLSYGYIFHMGFMNYYLSLGLASLGLSFAWPLRKNGLLGAAILAPVMLLAHPLGFLWFLGAIVYRVLWPRLPGAWKLLPLAVAVLILGAVHWAVAHHPNWDVEWRANHFWLYNGADQFHVFGDRYRWFTRAVVFFSLLTTALALVAAPNRINFLKERRLILELYFLCFCATTLLPENLLTDPTGGWIGALVSRLTLISAIVGLCWLASLPARSWYLAFSGVAAAIFFTFIYQDTAFLNRMEASADGVTQQLPFGTRAVSTIFAPNDYRTIFLHIPDRACIGHCFLVSNYEPSTRQFRVRVREGSAVVTASVDDSQDMQSGTYDVQEEDLPLKQIYQCHAENLAQICIRDLAEDEKNGRLGYHPVTNPFFSENP
jgi:hypothetical protein